MTPRVSVVIPALDEAPYIEACVRSVLAQRVEGGHEVIVVDGGSSDGTAELARAAGATVIDNPDRVIPAALNRGLDAARGDFFVRFDAHAEMPSGYIEKALCALSEVADAVNVGGWRVARGVGPWGRAAGAALASDLGVGNSRIWRPPRDGDGRREVQTVPLGCFRTSALREIGGWHESLHANEDFELNHRLRSARGRVVFDPAIWSIYRPRESLAGIARQYWNYGRWKAAVLMEAPRSLRPRQLAPPALVVTTLAASLPGRAGVLARTALALYGLAVSGASASSAAGWRTGPALTAMHLAWGLGLISGLLEASLAAGLARTAVPAPVTIARRSRYGETGRRSRTEV